VDLPDQLDDDDLLEELEDHFKHNYNDHQNMDLLYQMEDD